MPHKKVRRIGEIYMQSTKKNVFNWKHGYNEKTYSHYSYQVSERAVRAESFHLQTPDAFPKINSFHFELHWLPFIFIDICFQRWTQTEYLCDQFQSIDSLNLHRKWNMMWKVTSSVHCSGCFAIHRYNYWMFYFQSIECVQCG